MKAWFRRVREAMISRARGPLDGAFREGCHTVWKVEVWGGGSVLVAAPSELHAVMVAAAVSGDERRYMRAADELGAVLPVGRRPA